MCRPAESTNIASPITHDRRQQHHLRSQSHGLTLRVASRPFGKRGAQSKEFRIATDTPRCGPTLSERTLALRELEAAAGFRTAVFLASRPRAGRASGSRPASAPGADSAHKAMSAFEMPWRSAPAWPDRPPPHDLADDVVLSVASGRDQRLAQDHAQHGPREIDVLFACR